MGTFDRLDATPPVSSLHAMRFAAAHEPEKIDRTVSKLLPKVSASAAPPTVGTKRKQTECPFGGAPHDSAGSLAVVVARSVQILVELNVFDEMRVAELHRSLAGGAAA